VPERVRPALMEDDTETLVASICGTFVLGGYAQDEMDEVWVQVRRRVEKWIEERS
jgi:hypothetical protein